MAGQNISKVLGCSRRTISRGIKDLQALPKGTGHERRIRKAGGGRKRYDEIYPDIAKFLDVLKNHGSGVFCGWDEKQRNLLVFKAFLPVTGP